MCLPRSCEYCVKPCVWAPGACRPDDLHLGPTTCVRAAPPTCMSSGLGAYQGVQAHFQGLTCGRAAEGETELVRHCRCGAYSVTKFALLAKIRAFWVVLRMQGEFCPVLAASKLSGESFVPRPGWRPLRNSWRTAVRCWDWSPRPWVGSSQASTRTRIGNEHPDSLLTYPDAHNLSTCA